MLRFRFAHAHILLILGNKDKPQSPEIVDCLVYAEIPDIATNPTLFDVIFLFYFFNSPFWGRDVSCEHLG